MPKTMPADPIIAAITNHKKLDLKWLNMVKALDGADDQTNVDVAYS